MTEAHGGGRSSKNFKGGSSGHRRGGFAHAGGARGGASGKGHGASGGGARQNYRGTQGSASEGGARAGGSKDLQGHARGAKGYGRRSAQDGFKRDVSCGPKRGTSRGGQKGPRDEHRLRDGRDVRHDASRGERTFCNPRLSPARVAACAIGREVREREAFVSEVTQGVLAQMEGISPEDSAFATKLARGVTATVGTLDEFINRNLNSPDDIRDDVRDALRVSAYELLFLDKADYVAVDQGVELVCSVAPRATALANAVLRKMAKSAKAFPFGRPNLSLTVLARSQAFPLWLAKRLMNEMGLDKATAFMHACNTDAPVYIAINTLKAQDDEVIEVFDQAGSLLTPVEGTPGCYLVESGRALGRPEVRALFERGEVLASDASAQAVAALACPRSDVDAFLEVGSGRGTKTILLQNNAVRSFGRVIPMVSVDNHGFKAEVLTKRMQVYGIDTVRPLKADGRQLSQLMSEASFDAVLLDAPCSGVGTLRRHPEIRWRLVESHIAELASLQLDLLIEAAKMVKPQGSLTYATCTVFREENDQVVERFLKTKFGESFEVEERLSSTLIEKGPDAHFAVKLRRRR